MKKNFFKKLSFVLALAMIVSVLAPAAGAFAASKPKLSSTKKYLFLGQTNKYDFNISNKKSGWSYKWTSSNKAVATVASNGLTTGKSIGTAEISVVIKDKDGEEVTELTADVIVKDSIETVKISNAPEGKLLVGEEFDFNRSFVTYGGSTKKTTSVTKWEVDSEKASISSMGVFKATEAGEYTITAKSFQSNAKYSAWLKDASAVKVVPTDSIKVTVVASIDSVKQLDLNTVEVKFTSPMTDVAANLTVSSLVPTTNTKVKQTVKAVTMSDDKLTATVDMYADFAANTTYVVDFTGMEPKQFVGATTNVTDVVDMEITTTTATVTEATDIIVKLLNKDGVNIANSTLLSRVTLKSSSEKVYLNTATLPNEVTIYNVGDTTTIEAVYHTYSYDTTGNELGAITKTGTITGVATVANPVSSVAAWTLAGTAPTAYTTVNHIIAAEDPTTNIYVNAVKADGKTYINSGSTLAANTAFRFSTSDPSVLIVTPAGAVYPVKAGVANVVVEYCADTLAQNPVYTVLGAIPVTVGAKRVATTLNLSTYNFSLSTSNSLGDSKDVTIEVLDQYGVKMPADTVTVTEMANTNVGTDPITAENKGVVTTLTFLGSGRGAGDYTYAITTKGLTRYVVIKVAAPSPSSASTYRLSFDSSYDAKVSSTVTGTSVNVKVLGYAANGVAFNSLNTAGLNLSTATLSMVLVKPDGTTTTLTPDGTYAGTFAVSSVSGNTTYVQAPTGTYTVKLYSETGSAKTLIDQASFTVKNTQVLPTVVVKQLEAETGSNTLATAITDCFTVTDSTGADRSDDITVGSYIGDDASGATVFVKTIKLNETIGGYTLTHEIAVNTLIKIK